MDVWRSSGATDQRLLVTVYTYRATVRPFFQIEKHRMPQESFRRVGSMVDPSNGLSIISIRRAEAMIRVTCSNCGKSVRGGDDWAGRTAPCPHCKTPLQFNSAPAALSMAPDPIPPNYGYVAVTVAN